MAMVGKLSSASTGMNAKLNGSAPVMTIKTTSSATSIDKLSDIDQTKAEGKEAGATLVYDPATGTFKAEKVFTYDGDNVGLDGGGF